MTQISTDLFVGNEGSLYLEFGNELWLNDGSGGFTAATGAPTGGSATGGTSSWETTTHTVVEAPTSCGYIPAAQPVPRCLAGGAPPVAASLHVARGSAASSVRPTASAAQPAIASSVQREPSAR